MTKNKKQDDIEQQIGELTQDLQRTRADFENYRKRSENEKTAMYQHGQIAAVTKLLPVVDNIERAISHTPDELKDNKWAQGVTRLVGSIEKSLAGMDVKRIDASAGTAFNPELHEAIQVDEDAEGDHEVVAEELQAGYLMGLHPVRTAMVKVTRTSKAPAKNSATDDREETDAQSDA